MSKAYPTWNEQSVGGKAMTIGWLIAFVVGGLALAAVAALFAWAFVTGMAGALWDERRLWALIGVLFVIALVWGTIKERRA